MFYSHKALKDFTPAKVESRAVKRARTQSLEPSDTGAAGSADAQSAGLEPNEESPIGIRE